MHGFAGCLPVHQEAYCAVAVALAAGEPVKCFNAIATVGVTLK